MWKIVVFVVLLPAIIQTQVYQSQLRQEFNQDQKPNVYSTASRANPALYSNNVNNGIVKSLEARIAAMEELIREFETKEVLISVREESLELRRIELDKLAAENERRIREREIGLDKREQEITAYQNSIFKQQDEREQNLERARRGREQSLDERERIVERNERKLN